MIWWPLIAVVYDLYCLYDIIYRSIVDADTCIMNLRVATLMWLTDLFDACVVTHRSAVYLLVDIIYL